LCLVFVRSCYGVGAHYRSAAEAWHGAKKKHRQTDGDRVPRGVPFFWTGGSQGFGHVVLSAGGGMCWSNDVRVSGGIHLVSINEITRAWGQTPQGWAEDLNGLRVWEAPPKPMVNHSDLVRAFQKDPARPGDAGTPGARRDVRRLEKALATKGYLESRFVDGSYGTMTVAAMERFQREHGMAGEGAPTLESVRALGHGRFVVRS
jgi:hypothetical protein